MSNTAITLGAFVRGEDLGHFERCPRCREYDWTGIHKCKPTWLAILNEYHDEDEPEEVFANDAESAAITFAELNYGTWDYPSSPMNIWVRRNEDDEWQKFDVSVEAVPSFTATLQEPQPKNPDASAVAVS